MTDIILILVFLTQSQAQPLIVRFKTYEGCEIEAKRYNGIVLDGFLEKKKMFKATCMEIK